MTDKRTRGAPKSGTAVVWRAGFQEMLGVSSPTFGRWMRAGYLPAPDVQVGDRYGWRRETVDAFLHAQARLVAA